MHRRGHTFVQLYRVEKALADRRRPAYEVTQVRLGTPLLVTPVLDLSDPDLSRDDRERLKDVATRLQERMMAAAQLEHPRLVRLLDSFEEEQIHYAVLERVEGRTLRGLLAQSMRALDEDVVRSFAAQLLELFEYLHQRKRPFVLGNLSPDTIVVDGKGQLEVRDLNLHNLDEPPESDAFLAPELLGEASVDGRADLYSLGAVLYFALTGHELPPLWDRVTQTQALTTPQELGLTVGESLWNLLLQLLELPKEARPKSAQDVLAILRQSPQTSGRDSGLSWYPEQSDLPLGDSYPYAPLTAEDWILKMVQAAVGARARGLEVKQDREACMLDFRLAAPDVPSPRNLLGALCDEPPAATDMLDDLAAGLRIVGEFRDFSVTLDDWERSWTLNCVGGRISAAPRQSSGISGMRVKVRYIHQKRTQQSADELIRLERRTRLCPVPISIDGRALQPTRYTALPALPDKIEVLYLASVSLAEDSASFLTQGPLAKPGESQALTSFAPESGSYVTSHVDIRCYIETQEVLKKGFSFVCQPSRVMLYRRGVLCGWKSMDKEYPLQFDVHLHTEHFKADGSGLKFEAPVSLGANKEKALERVRAVVPTLRVKLEDLWESLPSESAPKTEAFLYGMVPLVTLFMGKVLLPGVVLLKSGLVGGLAKGGSVLGGASGYLRATSYQKEIQKACLKAIEAFEQEKR